MKDDEGNKNATEKVTLISKTVNADDYPYREMNILIIDKCDWAKELFEPVSEDEIEKAKRVVDEYMWTGVYRRSEKHYDENEIIKRLMVE